MLVQATTPASYDYVVVGGGTAGSVLANRLSEEPSVTVAVIEAGGWALHDPLVEDIYGGCLACGTQVDWNYTSMPQAFANNTVGQYHAGRCLGGSSAINGIFFEKAYLNRKLLTEVSTRRDLLETIGAGA